MVCIITGYPKLRWCKRDRSVHVLDIGYTQCEVHLKKYCVWQAKLYINPVFLRRGIAVMISGRRIIIKVNMT